MNAESEDVTGSGTANDLVWYGSLLVWVGCASLLIESLAGHSTATVTVLSVIFVIVGFLGFLGGLAAEGRSWSWLSARVDAPETDAPTPADRTPDIEPLRSATHIEASVPVDRPAPVPLAEPEVLEEPILEPSTSRLVAPRAPARQSVATEEILPASQLVGQTCPHCHGAFVAHDITGVCWNCGASHHAACWVQNRFHCATPGCIGTGSLEAPNTAQTRPNED